LFILCIYISYAAGPWHLNTTIPWTMGTKSVDISVVYNGFYYLADTTNGAVQVVNIATLSFLSPITGFSGPNSGTHAGPNGLAIVTYTTGGKSHNELWCGIANSSVCVVNLTSNTVETCISTRGQQDCDELDHNPNTGLVVVTNPDDSPPFVTFISVHTRTVVKQINITNATSLEQPLFNLVDNKLYLSVPATNANPSGEVNVYSTSYSLDNVIVEDKCSSRGLVFASDGVTLFMTCSSIDPVHFHTLIYNVSSNQKIGDISDVSEGDEAAYDPNTNLFFGTGYPLITLGIQQCFTVVNATSPYNLIQKVSTSGSISHSIAVDPTTGFVFVPLDAGVGVFNIASVLAPRPYFFGLLLCIFALAQL